MGCKADDVGLQTTENFHEDHRFRYDRAPERLSHSEGLRVIPAGPDCAQQKEGPRQLPL
jgi:hypothetical protein